MFKETRKLIKQLHKIERTILILQAHDITFHAKLCGYTKYSVICWARKLQRIYYRNLPIYGKLFVNVFMPWIKP